MKAPRNGPRVVTLSLLLTGCLAAGLAQTSRADMTAGSQKTQTPVRPASLIVKIGQAMVQERQTFPDGMIYLETYFNAASAAAAKAVKTDLDVATLKKTKV